MQLAADLERAVCSQYAPSTDEEEQHNGNFEARAGSEPKKSHTVRRNSTQ